MSKEEGKTESSEHHKNSSVITIRKNDLWKYSTILLAAVVILLVIFFVVPGNGSTTNNNPTPSTGGVIKASVDDDAMEGEEKAPVTIIEFSDFQCPFCRKFWTESYSQIKTNYIDTGKVNLVYRDFPLTSIHPMAQKSAEASECVQDKYGDAAFYKFHDKMYEEQNIIDSGSASGPVTKTATYTTDDLKSWAKELGYDIASCLDSGEKASEVSKDLADGQKYGVTGTPAFLIGNDKEGYKLLSGAQPYAAFQQAIEAYL